ncbi:hypothetical protein LguiB_001058 [Lonicera macranthoides]
MFNCSDELKNFFSKYGAVVEHQIIRDHETNCSRGFGFVIFDSEKVVEMLSNGNMIDMADTQWGCLFLMLGYGSYSGGGGAGFGGSYEFGPGASYGGIGVLYCGGGGGHGGGSSRYHPYAT